jgi:hypothetical protein
MLEQRRRIQDPEILTDEIVKNLELDAAAARPLAETYLEEKIWDVNGRYSLEIVPRRNRPAVVRGRELDRQRNPARPGGDAAEALRRCPLDYQLLADEDVQGFTRLYLVISPRVEIADEAAVITLMMNALRESSPMADAARSVWQHTGTIQIKRMEPIRSERGKQLPLHIRRSPPCS